jgi:type II secretion system protein C
MPKFPKIDFAHLLKRGQPHAAMAASTNHGPRSSLSVNSLSKISGQLNALGRGETIRSVSFWLCFLLCANFTADLFTLLFEKYLPAAPTSALANRGHTGNTFSGPGAYDIIADRNLFSSKAPKKPSDGIDLDAEPVPTTLSYQLIGTVIFHNPARSLAAVQDKTENKLYPVRMGDSIGDNVQILSVEPRRVVFINAQARRKEYVEIPEDPAIKISQNTFKPAAAAGIAQVDDNKFTLSRSEIDSQLANFNVLITQARAIPEMRGGQMMGFKLTQIVPGSFYQKAGFKENDIITSVNGEKITDAAKALQLLQEIKSMSSLDIGVESNGKAVNRNYDIR